MHLPRWQVTTQHACSSGKTCTSRHTVVRNAHTNAQHRQQQWQQHVEPGQQQQQRPQLGRTARQQQRRTSAPQHAGDGRSQNKQSICATETQREPADRPQQQRRAPTHAHPPSTDPRDIQFMQLEGLQQLVTERSHALTAAQLASVFVRAAKLRPMTHQQQRQALLGPTWAALRGQLSRCKAQEVVMLLWAAAKLGYRDPDVYSSTLDHLLAPSVLNTLKPRFLSNVVYAVASAPAEIREQHVGSALTAVLPVLLQERKLHGCNAQDVANVFWALGTLGLTVVEPSLGQQQLLEALQQLLEQLKTLADKGSAAPQANANTLWALARLDYPASEQLLLQLSDQVLAQTDNASAHDASSSIWALATLLQQQQQQQQDQATPLQQQQQQHKVQVQEQWQPQQQHWQQPALQAESSATSPELRTVVLRLLDIVAAPAFGRVNCHSLALALWGTAKLGVAVPAVQLRQLLQLCLQNSNYASTQDIANILYAFASMHIQQQAAATGANHQQQQQQQQPQEEEERMHGGQDVVLQQYEADVLLAAAAAGAATAEPQAIANSLWATAKLALQVPVDSLKGLVKPFTAHAMSGAAYTQHLANTLWALATMQAGADGDQQQQQSVQDGYQQQTNLQQQQQQQWRQQQQQGEREPVPPRVINVLLAAFTQQLQYSSTQEACNVLWAAAKLQYCVDHWEVQLLVDHVLQQSGSFVTDDRSPTPATNGVISMQQQQQQQQQPQQQQQQQQRKSQGGGMLQLEPQLAANMLWSIATIHQLQKQQQQQQQDLSSSQLLPQQQPVIQLPPLHQLQLLLSAVLGQLHKANDQELVNSLWAAARLEPCVLPEGLLSQQMLSAIAGRVAGMNMQAVANLAYALGQLGAVEAGDLLVMLLQRGLQLTQQYNRSTTHGQSHSSGSSSAGSNTEAKLYQALPNLCWSAAVLGVTGQAELLRALAAAAARHCWQQITPLGASQLYMLHMALQFEEQEAEQHQQHQQQLPPQQQQQQEPWQQVASMQKQQGAPSKRRRGGTKGQQQQHQQQHQQQQQMAVVAAAAGGLSDCMTKQQLQQCRAAWVNCGSNPQDKTAAVAGSASRNAQTQHRPASGKFAAAGFGPQAVVAPGFNLQRKVFVAAQHLHGLRRPPCYEAPTPDELFSIDIQAETVSGVQLAIEVDGPSHFRVPDMGLTGTTLFRNKQLAARGYVVVSVPFMGWNAAVTEAQQQQQQQQQQRQQEEGGKGRTSLQGQQLQQQQRQQQQRDGEEDRIVAEGLMGVRYLQGLVDAAVKAASSVQHAGPHLVPSNTATDAVSNATAATTVVDYAGGANSGNSAPQAGRRSSIGGGDRRRRRRLNQ